MSTLHARTVEEVQALVRGCADARRGTTAGSTPGAAATAAYADEVGERARPLRPVAARSKSALSGSSAIAGHDTLDVSAIAGVIDYQPAECTFSARAGTRIADIEAMLVERGQYLPFEPPFADRGATIGGTVATALSGPGRFRYGGVRDFLLGVRFVDGTGRVIRGGGRVVKNAAGFYLQHLLLGSLGTLGVLTEVTCKVFPRAQSRATVVAEFSTLVAAIDALARLRRSPFELESAELIPPGRLLLRLGGSRSALDARVDALSTWLRQFGAAAAADVRQLVDEAEERACWHEARELTWAPRGVPLVKVASTLGRLARLDERLAAAGARTADAADAADAANAAGPARHDGAGGDVTWIAWPRPLHELDAILTEFDMPGLVVLGADPPTAVTAAGAGAGPLIGRRPDPAFLARVRQTLDPHGVFSRHD
jgi:glycolate oxidase FAD binding subunit